MDFFEWLADELEHTDSDDIEIGPLDTKNVDELLDPPCDT